MTVCIAALAENKEKLVLVADQMITANIPIAYQYETDDVKKIYGLTENSYVLSAGNALFANEIVENSLKKIKATEQNTLEGIAEITRSEYQNYRLNLVIKMFLEPRGLDLAGYYNYQQRLVLGVVQEIENNLVNFNLGVDFIIAGYNSDGCHVYSITHPGVLVSHDAVGYVCVGIGAPHATYYLIGSEYKKSLSVAEVEKLVKEAKKKSEVAPGVGKETTIKTISLKKDQNGEEQSKSKK